MLKKLLALFVMAFLYFFDASVLTEVKLPVFKVQAFEAPRLVSPVPVGGGVGVVKGGDVNRDGVVNSIDLSVKLKNERAAGSLKRFTE